MKRILLLALFLLAADFAWSQTLCTENRCYKLQDELGFYIDTGNPLPTYTSTFVAANTLCTENRCVKLVDKNGFYIDANNPLPTTGGGGGGSGTVTQINTTSPITGGPITTTGTIACPTCLVSGGSGFVSSITGTALQITASAATGAVTLSIPAVASIATSLTVPLHIGGTGTTSALTLQSTSGVGTTGADIIFLTGSNGATEAARILNSGFVGIGSTNPAVQLQVSSTSASDPRGIMSAQYTTDAIGARFHLRKARGTEASPTTIVTGDVLGRIRFSGYDGTNYLQMGSIDVTSTGTIASTRVPTTMTFSTATDAAPSVLTTALTLGKDQSATFTGAITTTATGSSSAPIISVRDTLTGIWSDAVGHLNFSVNGNQNIARWQTTGFLFTFSSSTGAQLVDDAAHVLSLRNGANAQNSRIYNTYTDASNNEYLQLGFTSNVATLSTVANGTGTARSIAINPASGGTVSTSASLTVSGTMEAYGSSGGAIIYPVRSANLRNNSGTGTGIDFAMYTSTSTESAFGQIYVYSPDSTGSLNNGQMIFKTRNSGTLTEWWRIDNVGVFLSNDVGVARNASGVLEINSGTAGTLRDIVGRTPSWTGSETILNATSIPAGGTAGSGYKFSSTSNFGVFFGSGAPTLAAAKGSLYLRSDGTGATDRAYINTDGGTTWTNLVTAG